MSSLGRSMASPACASARRRALPGDVVQRPQHRGDVAQRGVGPAAVLERAQRVALEADHAIAVIGDEQPAQVEVAVDAHHRGGGGHGLEPRQARGDGRGVAPELDGDRRVHRADRVDGQVELAMRVPAPGLQLVVGGLARSEVRGIGRRRGERGVEPRDQRPEVRRDVRRPVQRHAARRRDEVRRGTPPSARRRRRHRGRTPGASPRVATPPSRVTASAQPARRGTPVNRASSER